MPQTPRTCLHGVDAIHAALEAGQPVQLILVNREESEKTRGLVERGRALGVEIWQGGEGDLRRMSADSHQPALALALLGQSPHCSLDALVQRQGLLWLLHRPAFPSNVGFIIRTAEVSGAAGVVIDAPDFNREHRSRASHVSMGADRVLPVQWTSSTEALQAARAAGRQIVAVEDSGDRGPHEVDLTRPSVLIVGNERAGIPPEMLAACHQVIRIPMLGFVPSYSVQAAVSALAWESMRQADTLRA